MEAQNKKFGHLMLDIETFGKYHNPAILSIAAVEFNIETGETGKEFHEKISLQSCLDAGLRVDESTITWWMEQDDDARKKLFDGEKKELSIVLLNFNSFIRSLDDNENIEIWGNGISFDISFLRAAYFLSKINFNWSFRYERDVRTLVSFAPEIKNDYVKFIGTKHDALDDCKHQIRYCSETYKLIKPVNKIEDINDKLLADLRNKLSPPYGLASLVERGLEIGFEEDLVKIIKNEIEKTRKTIEFITQKNNRNK